MSEEAPPKEAKISQADIDRIVAVLDRMEKRRRIMLAGYFLAVIVLVLGEIGALWVVGTSPPGSNRFWVYLVPFTLTGLVLWGFGRWANSLRRSETPPAA